MKLVKAVWLFIIKHRKLIQTIGITVGLGILTYQIIIACKSIFDARISILQPWAILFGILLLIIALFQQMAAWRTIMNGLGIKLPWRKVIMGYPLTFLPRYIPGSIWGYLSRGEWLLNSHSVSYKDSNLGSILEVGISVSGCLFIILNAWVVRLENMDHWVLWVTFISSLLGLTYMPKIFSKFMMKFEFLGKAISPKEILIPFQNWFVSFLLFVLNGLIYGFVLQLLVNITQPGPLKLSFTDWFLFSGIYNQAWLLGFVIVPIPSGIGLREITLAYLLSAQVGVGVETANFSAVLTRLLVACSEILLVFLGVLLNRVER